MLSRSQVDRLAARIEALAPKATREVIVVVEPNETNEEALARLGIATAEIAVAYFVRTGVPRSKDWGRSW